MNEILPGLFQRSSTLSGPHHAINSYVLRNRQSVCIVDPAADFMDAELNASDVLITHLHQENAEGAHNFRDASVHLPEGDLYLARGRSEYDRHCTKWAPPWEWETRGNYQGHLAGAKNERPLDYPLNRPIPLGRKSCPAEIEWISTPGHGKNAVTYLAIVSGRRIAFCGDLVYGNGQLWNWYDSEWDYGLEAGPRAILCSARKLLEHQPDMLLPTHGPVVTNASEALSRLCIRLERVLKHTPGGGETDTNFPEVAAPAAGFRQICSNLYQWRTGNCAVLVSRTGHALLVDCGLCHWVPLDERAIHFREVITELKRKLGIHRVDVVIPTHYHGDHTENIPDMVNMDRSEVVCLDSICGPLETPEAYNLAAPLPWYGTHYDRITVNRKVREREIVRWREYELELFHLGGQTYYHLGISAEIDGQRVLFVGDAMHNRTTLTSPMVCYNDMEPATRGWAGAVERMLERNPDLLVCGHGSAIRNPLPLLSTMRAAWNIRLAEYAELNPRPSARFFFDPFVQ